MLPELTAHMNLEFAHTMMRFSNTLFVDI